MEFLSEDPTYLAGGLALLAVAFLIALRVSQQGKFLVWAGVALALAAAVVGIERVWVTDNERIEQVVYDLRREVENSNAEGVLALLTPNVHYVSGGGAKEGEAVRDYIRGILKQALFDFLRISHLKASAGGQSRRGKAEFRVIAGGSFGSLNFGTAGSDWSLGFEETSPKVWKVNRISPTRVPGEMPQPPGIAPPKARRPFMIPAG